MKNNLSLMYRLVLILTTIFGLYTNFNHSGVSKMIVYYTILSNIACLVFFCITFIFQSLGILNKNQSYYIVKFTLTTAILITMLAFELIIRPYIHSKTGYCANNIRDVLVHFVIPLMVLFDYLFFDEKGNLNFSFLPYVTIFPTLYTLIVYLYSKSGGTFRAFKQVSNYPYIFMDYDKVGNMVFLYCGMVLAIFVLVGFTLIKIDLVLSQKNNRL